MTIQGGREVAELTAPLTGDKCFIRLFGWSDLVLAVKVPPLASRVQASQPVP